MGKDLDSAVEDANALHGKISRAYENLMKLGAEKITLGAVEVRLKALEKNWSKFKALNTLIAGHAAELEGDPYLTEDTPALAEEAFLTNKGQLRDKQRELTAKLPAAAGASSQEPQFSNHNLPKLQLPHFSGKFEDWPAWRDLFQSMILDKASLTKVQKMQYLKTCVKGDAEPLIQDLPATADNLEGAWDTLTSHFENKRLLVRAYLSAFTALPRMKTPSATDLRRIFHGVLSTVGRLEGIGRPITASSDLFVHMVVELLDPRTRRDWKKALGRASDPPSYERLKSFLQEQMMTLDALRAVSGEPAGKQSEKASRSARSSHVGGKGPDPHRSCPLCKKEHFLAYCDLYKKKTAQERREIVSTHQRCWNCLGRHVLAECPSSKTCGKCSAKHHTTLHDALAAAALPLAAPSPAAAVHVAKRPPTGCGSVLLATARVMVRDRFGTRLAVRALIDPRSETSLVAESLAQRLRLPRTPSSVAIYGVGGIQTGHSRGRVVVSVHSQSGDFSVMVSPLVLPRLTVYSGASGAEARAWPHVTGLELADPEFIRQYPVELLLGAEAYPSIVLPELRRGGASEPIAQRTRLGWVLLGAVGTCHAVNPVTSMQCTTVAELGDLVRRFWEAEEPPRAPLPLTDDEAECEEHFARTHERLPDGRYQVRLPTRPGLPNLAPTHRAAARLLEVMTWRFARDRPFGERYRAFMSDYLALGHMSPVTAAPSIPGAAVCYLPHHGVMKGFESEAKIRVVFNGSSRTMGGSSLNASLHVGPNLLPALADVLTRWRRHRYVFVADVEKMYRQIMVHPADRDLQRILWGEQPSLEYRLNTVTYGLACAPYLAIRVFRQLANDEEANLPMAAVAMKRDIYVDDVLTEADQLESGRELARQVSALFMAGGFPLRKWAANHEALLEDVPPEHHLRPAAAAQLPSIDPSVLGLRWNPTDDDLAIVVQRTRHSPPTKRSVLSQTARLFDPLGWLAPIVIRAKLLVQTAWLQRLDWDAPLDAREASAWIVLEEELELLEGLRIPRWFGSAATSPLELHGFSDASELAYAAVVYLRACSHASITVSLVAARTRVAPLKRVPLPRLELCAAALLAKLAEHTDSTVTLGWVRGHPAKWNTYIANRVSEIQRSNPEATWRHVPGRENPADCASRGVSPRELLEHPLWWRGPHYLREVPAAWPVGHESIDEESLPEHRPPRCFAAVRGEEPDELLRFSNLRRLLRVSAWLWR
ncbi:PREDICTED: uncharacterized protein LOC105556094 [Vollenhovia emeryi]|uniref:uncharacterized protein LOC105556094 n=1 Tax=Vollenhovia emeryi TaxID=411798 RepID=UPI0005F3BA26|nr:PREDICTED: uncharacterized protein LOC105556094 [Vollenhovia emeryi]